MYRFIFLLFSFALFHTSGVQAQGKVSITPEYPTPGEMVTIYYQPDHTGVESEKYMINFTYSNFYELPQKMPMQKSGKQWEASFRLPRYAILAAFVIENGNQTLKPSDKRHYQIVVYNDKRERVEKSYLYEGYSLATQEGKSPELKKNQAVMFAEELKHYPDNYEAKLRLLSYEVSVAGESEKQKLYDSANKIIAGMFYRDPGKMAYMNMTTMGYLIMGEKSRLDSLYNVIRNNYPKSEGGYELRIAKITSGKDPAKMVKALEDLLKEENSENKNYLKEAHKELFGYYASKGNKVKTIYHMGFLKSEFTPYLPKELKQRAELLYKYNILLDTAFHLSEQSLSLADTFPISLIRYFPETGYLPSYVSREQRASSIKDVTGQLKSLMALIRIRQGRKSEASMLMKEALSLTEDPETLKNAGSYFSGIGNHESAFQQFRKVAYNDAEDTTSYKLMVANYKKWKGSLSGFNQYDEKIKGHWMEEMNKELQKEIISKPMPGVLENYVDLKGRPLKPGLIKNKIVVMDFWATWCVPCMKAMPYMELVYQKYKNDPDVVFMIVNSGAQNQLSDAQNWWGNKKFSFPVYYNKDSGIGEKLGFNLIPATYIIDKSGNIRFKTLGFEGEVMTRKIAAQIEMLR